MNTTNHILLTFDVEDWFQVENFKPYIPFSSWPRRELRVEQNTHKLLDLLDQQSNQPPLPRSGIGSDHFHPESDSDKNKSQNSGKSCLITPKATFFVLGWIAERLPGLVREIHSRGHEVASHGYSHELCTDSSPQDLRKDLIESKERLEDILAAPIYGYRAPSFSINETILKIIEACGYLYDSSYNSFGMHGRYGHLDISRNSATGIAIPVNRKSTIENRQFFELPISNIDLLKCVLPWGGGGYFRLIPFPLFKIGVKSILSRQHACLFYFHPWEVDPAQPRVNQASLFLKFRHYTGLQKTASKLSSFIEAFKHCNFMTCHQYLQLKMPYLKPELLIKGMTSSGSRYRKRSHDVRPVNTDKNNRNN